MAGTVISILVIVVLTIIILSKAFSKKTIVLRKLKRTPSKKIRDFRNGDMAKIVGEVEFTKLPLKAPLSGRECTYYYVLVEKQVSNGKSASWKKIIEEEITEDFIIREGENIALIDTNIVKSYLVPDKKYKSGFLNDATSNLESYLHKHGLESKGLFGMNKTLRYREGIIEAGETVAVVGTGQWTEVSKEFPNKRILKIAAKPENPVYLTDDPTALNFVESKNTNLTIGRSFKQFEKKNRKRYVKDYK